MPTNKPDWPKYEDYQLNIADKPPTSPAHYQRLRPQPIEVIESWGLGFHEANIIKYVARAGYKGGPQQKIEDLEKALFYLTRLIAKAKAAGEQGQS